MVILFKQKSIYNAIYISKSCILHELDMSLLIVVEILDVNIEHKCGHIIKQRN